MSLIREKDRNGQEKISLLKSLCASKLNDHSGLKQGSDKEAGYLGSRNCFLGQYVS